MNTQLYLHYFVACLIGNVAHIAFKIYSLSIDYKKANMPFTIFGYLRDDKWALLADAAGSFALVYIVDEWIHDPKIMEKIKTIFVVIGFTGSYLILQITSQAKNKFRKTVDEKSNVADFGTKDKPTNQ